MEQNQCGVQLPRYKCHKEVSALKIKAIVVLPSRPRTRDHNTIELHFEEQGYAPIVKDPGWHQRHNPQVGGYYVVYDDGYTSFSPAKAFEEGYSRI
ncbi:MAG TPA: hypothetical protein VG897_12915 [Terriglobales bacterium]|nr:hypothetical protein [Terriglobales bacterium]